jgi:hypothetical protein
MQWFQYLIAPLVAGIVAALASTYLTAWFSFRRFRREQWWQAKRDAYESVIRALSEIMFDSYSDYVRLETTGNVVPPKAPDREKELTWSLQEISSGGAYIVSDKTVATVEALLKQLAAPDGDADADTFKAVYEKTKKAMQAIKLEAHRDLGVEKPDSTVQMARCRNVHR